jgi:molecular chaperone DnaK
LIYVAEKSLREAGDKVDTATRGQIEDRIKAVKDALEKDDTETIKKTTAELSEIIQKIGQAVYSTQNQESGSRNQGEQGEAKEADFTQEPTDKKEGEEQ